MMVKTFKTSPQKLCSKRLLVGLILFMGLFLVSFASAITWDNIAYYSFEEGSGTTSADLTGNGYNLGGVNTPGWSASGKIGNSADFNHTESEYFYNESGDLALNASFTVNAWVFKETQYDSYMGAVTLTQNKATEVTRIGIRGWTSETGLRVVTQYTDGSAAVYPTILGLGKWIMVTQVVNSTGMSVYINGTLIDYVSNTSLLAPLTETNSLIIGAHNRTAGVTYFWDGKIDEVGLWDRALTSAEISELWNGGSGLTYSLGSKLTLIAPANNSLISDVGANFTVNYTMVDMALKNGTYYMWFTNGTTFNVTTFAINPTVSNQTSEYFDSFGLGYYLWNVKAQAENATGTYDFWAEDNFTLQISPFSKISERWVNTTVEGSTDLFAVNISLLLGNRLSSIRFYYNGTAYSASYNEYESNKYAVTRTHNIPLVAADTNVTFYWNITLETGSSMSSATENQTILDTAIDNCSTYTYLLFNLSVVDEKTQSLLVGATDNTSVKIEMSLYDLDKTTNLLNFSQHYDKVNPAAVCFKSPVGLSRFRLDAIIEYDSDPRFVEFYNIQNYVLSNSAAAQNLTLYNLKESEGQEFKITYKGEDFVAVSEVIVQIQRKYIDEGVFKTIEIPMSGTNGFTIAHLVPNDIVYNLVFLKEGVILDSFTDVIATCQNPTITECEINLNALITGDNILDLVTDDEFSSSLSFNKDTRVITSNFVITSGVPGLVSLNATLMDNFGNTTVCYDSLTAAGGTLTCTVPLAFGNSTIYAAVSYNGEVKNYGYIRQEVDPKDRYGGVLIMASIILLLFMFGMGISDNAMITGVFLIIGAVLLVGLNLVYSTSWFGAGATILWFIVAVIIVMIKGGKR